MSYTTILAVAEGKPPETIKELHNSHGSGPVIWNPLCQKYYGTKNHAYMFDGTLDKLWPRYKDLSIPEHHRAVLMMTYDRAYIHKANYQRAARDLRKFLLDFPPVENTVNHLEAIAEIYESDTEHSAIGWYCTSVSENPFEGEWNEEKEEHDLVDWRDCFEIYEELDALKAA